MTNELIFLKLGGSLITDKNTPYTARRRVIRRLANEIKMGLEEHPQMSLVLGHGSGSFGHTPAAKYGTRSGVKTRSEWFGFVEVWKEARALNQIVMEECLKANLPVIAFPPSATILTAGRKVVKTSESIISAALQAYLIPVVFGDVIFDQELGGTILSTEEVFASLVGFLSPSRILLAGLERGVYQDFANRQKILRAITPESYKILNKPAGESASIDVTGGMAKKVESMIQLVSLHPKLSVQIFSGGHPGTLSKAILGGFPGTKICYTPKKEGSQ